MSRRKIKPIPEAELVEIEEAGSSKPISGAQAVRNALGKGLTEIDDIDDFVRTQYSKEIPRQQISAYKSQANKKAGEAPAKRGRRPKAAIEGYVAPPPASKGDGDLIDALRALKPLVAKVGADKVKELADLLS